MKIEILFPEICNLYGDLGNIRYLKESDPSIEIIETSLKSEPAFNKEKVDLIYMGTTTENGIVLSVNALKPYVSKLKKLIDEGQFILLTGNALDIWGTYIDTDDINSSKVSRIEGLDILKTHSEYHMMKRHNSFFIGEFNTDGVNGTKVVGFKSIFGHTYADENDGDDTNTAYAQQGWFKTIRGVGQNPEVIPEGFKVNHLFATYLIGPLLPLNPQLTAWLLKELGSDCPPAYEEAAINAYNQRLKELSNEHFDPNY